MFKRVSECGLKQREGLNALYTHNIIIIVQKGHLLLRNIFTKLVTEDSKFNFRIAGYRGENHQHYHGNASLGPMNK